MPRGKRRSTTCGKTKNKSKKSKEKNKNKNRNKNWNIYSAERIQKEVNEIRIMIANNNEESAMNKINLIDEYLNNNGETLPLILNSLKCVILAQYKKYDALKLLFYEISNNANKWDTESLNCLIKACKESGEIKYLMMFLDSAFNDESIPKTEDKSRDLYGAYFINSKYDKLSSLAQKMKRTFKHNGDEYTIWSIIAALVKVMVNHFKEDKAQLNNKEDTVLKVLQFQFERQFINNKYIINDSLIHIYYKILKLRKEWSQLNTFIDGNIIKESFIDKNKLKLWKLECLINLNKWHQIDKLCSSLLKDKLFIDDWQIWMNWIDAQFIIKTDNALCSLFIRTKMKDKLRAPFLSEIEFNLKSMQFNNTFDDTILIALIIKYFNHFSWRNSCCFDDLKKYLNYIKHETKIKKLLGSMRDCIHSEHKERKDEADIMRVETCYYQIELYFGVWMKQNDHQLIQKVQDLYNKNQFIIAVHILLYLAHKNTHKTRHFIMDAIFLLELGIIKYPFNFELKLYLLRIYSFIGNITAGFKQFESMKICGVQYDSLSHTLYHDAARYGFISIINIFDHEMMNHRKEFAISNLCRMPQCFKYKKYHKVIEFAEFNYGMKQSEMFIISQSHYVWNKLLKYHEQQHVFPNIVDYFEAFILPNHPYFEEKEKEEKEWIGFNDYSTIPMYIAKEKQSYYHKLLLCSPVSTLSNNAISHNNKEIKKCHTQLLLLCCRILYKSLTNKVINKELTHLWSLLKTLKFVHCDIAIDNINIMHILPLCNNNNYHLILLFSFHALNVLLLANNDIFIKNLAFVCDKMATFTDDLRIMIDKEVNKDSNYQLNGIHLEKLWRFVSFLCFTSLILFKYWLTQTKSRQILNKVIMDQYQFISKKTEKLKRTLAEILKKNIGTRFKLIDIDENNGNEKQLDKILKQCDINELIQHESSINLDQTIKNKNKLREIKIAIININNNMIQNNIDILKQNTSMLRQLLSIKSY